MDEHTAPGGGSANRPPFPRPQIDTSASMSARDSIPGDPQDPDGIGDSGGFRPPSPDQPAEGARARNDNDRVQPEQPRVVRANRALHDMADRLDDMADRLENLVGAQLGGTAGARAGDVAQATSGKLHDVADYLRTSDLRTLSEDLTRQVQEKPVQTLLVAVSAGWIAGKIVR